jgi:hypothetical protein
MVNHEWANEQVVNHEWANEQVGTKTIDTSGLAALLLLGVAVAGCDENENCDETRCKTREQKARVKAEPRDGLP